MMCRRINCSNPPADGSRYSGLCIGCIPSATVRRCIGCTSPTIEYNAICYDCYRATNTPDQPQIVDEQSRTPNTPERP
jgi:hypothetical protein